MPELRLTFLGNEYSEAVMLASQFSIDPQRRFVLSRMPQVKDVDRPYRLRMNRLENQALWLRALRRDTAMGGVVGRDARVEAGRIELLKALKARNDSLLMQTELLNEVIEGWLADLLHSNECATLGQDSLWRHVQFARSIGCESLLLHRCIVRHESLGVDEEYCFITMGDLDVYLDIGKVEGWLGEEHLSYVYPSEGIPFSEGFAGRRAKMLACGFECGEVTTTLIYSLGGDMVQCVDLCCQLLPSRSVDSNPFPLAHATDVRVLTHRCGHSKDGAYNKVLDSLALLSDVNMS